MFFSLAHFCSSPIKAEAFATTGPVQAATSRGIVVGTARASGCPGGSPPWPHLGREARKLKSTSSGSEEIA
eukprot:8145045-Pyramimonas_sp.AAC.1